MLVYEIIVTKIQNAFSSELCVSLCILLSQEREREIDSVVLQVLLNCPSYSFCQRAQWCGMLIVVAQLHTEVLLA